MTTFAMMNVWIDGHNMTIIEVDGVAIKPYIVDVIPIASAQRYSVLVTAHTTRNFNYLLHVQFEESMFGSNMPEIYRNNVTVNIQYDESAPYSPGEGN
jgi:iron transport multicopper oxidase